VHPRHQEGNGAEGEKTGSGQLKGKLASPISEVVGISRRVDGGGGEKRKKERNSPFQKLKKRFRCHRTSSEETSHAPTSWGEDNLQGEGASPAEESKEGTEFLHGACSATKRGKKETSYRCRKLTREGGAYHKLGDIRIHLGE